MRNKPDRSVHEFATTWWTLVEQARSDGTAIRTEAIDLLVRRYLPPLRAHLILRKRLSEDVADDVLQAFVADKILSQYLLRHADREKGKFRSLLLSSLDNFFIDWIRKNPREQGLPVNCEEPAAAQSQAADIFDAAWASQLLNDVLTEMKSECEANNQHGIWGVFENRLLAPALSHVAPVAYETLCERFELESPEKASNALVTAKRKFEKAFARVAIGYQHDDEQPGDVLRELTAVLSRIGPLDWNAVPAARGAPPGGAPSAAPDLNSSHPRLLVHLLEAPTDVDALWPPEDLAGLMRHQLRQKLADMDLRISPAVRNALTAPSTVPPIVTLADLYSHAQPPLELLEAVKRFGRQRVHRAEKILHEEIASALYFASIATALVCHDQRITKSDDELLVHGFCRLLERSWIVPPLRGRFEESLARLRPPTGHE